jgi:hypothetical protein
MSAHENFEDPGVAQQGTILKDGRVRLGGRRKGSRAEARGIRNIGTPNFGSRFSRMSRASRITGCGTGEPFQHLASTMLAGPSERSSLTAKPFREYKTYRT